VLSKPDLLQVFFPPGLSRPARPFAVDLTTFVGYAVYAWSLQFQIILKRVKEAADLFGWQANICVYCLDSILLMWLKVVWMYSRKVTRCLLAGSVSLTDGWMDGCVYLFLAVHIPPDSGLQELQLISDHGWSMLGPGCV